MTERASTVALRCGLPGAGKPTYAMALARGGYVRLPIDEVVWQRIGRQGACAGRMVLVLIVGGWLQ
ncbi:hypothetical protein [Streptomyces sp. NPDC023838]|uniref:hypothetical protein n=1 Tax=Streptomyces sp. NPDC023838 TaxID=3154325 RepID=UPI003403A7A8